MTLTTNQQAGFAALVERICAYLGTFGAAITGAVGHFFGGRDQRQMTLIPVPVKSNRMWTRSASTPAPTRPFGRPPI